MIIRGVNFACSIYLYGTSKLYYNLKYLFGPFFILCCAEKRRETVSRDYGVAHNCCNSVPTCLAGKYDLKASPDFFCETDFERTEGVHLLA